MQKPCIIVNVQGCKRGFLHCWIWHPIRNYECGKVHASHIMEPCSLVTQEPCTCVNMQGASKPSWNLTHKHKILVQLWKCKVSKPSCSLAHDAKTIPKCASSSKVRIRPLAPLQTAPNPCTIVNAQRCKQICKPYYNLAHDTRIMYWLMLYARCLSKPSCDLAYNTRTLANCECAKVQASIFVTQEPRCTIVNVPDALQQVSPTQLWMYKVARRGYTSMVNSTAPLLPS
jgi:hypothetical protein